MEPLTEKLRAILDRAASRHGEDWTEEENAVYEEAGRWRAGAEAVRDLRVAEIIAVVREHPPS